MRRKDDDDEDEESFTLQISLTSTLTWSLEKLIIVFLAMSHSKLTDPHRVVTRYESGVWRKAEEQDGLHHGNNTGMIFYFINKEKTDR